MRIFTIENDTRSKDIFEKVKAHRKSIEGSLGCTLQWEESMISKKPKCRIYLERTNSDLRDESQWQRQHDWLIHRVAKMFMTLRPYYDQFER